MTDPDQYSLGRISEDPPIVELFYIITLRKRIEVEGSHGTVSIQYEEETFDGVFEAPMDEPIKRREVLIAVLEHGYREMDASADNTSVTFFYCEENSI